LPAGFRYGAPVAGWALEDVVETARGELSARFSGPAGRAAEAVFRHADFPTDGEGWSRAKNWSVRCPDAGLVGVLLPALKESDVADFPFFKPAQELASVPFGTVLTVTSRCNIFCYYCFNEYDYDLKGRNSMANLSWPQVREIVEKLYAAGTRDVIITGGEPFTWPHLFDLLDHLASRRMFAHVNTNGTMLTDAMLKRLDDKYAVNLMVSMHEFNDAEYFDANRKGLEMTFGKKDIVDGFRTKFSAKVAQLRKVRDFPNLSLDFLTILSPRNILFLEKIVAWGLENFTLNDWQFFRLYSTKNNPGISRTMIALAIHKLAKLNRATGRTFHIVDSVPFCATKDTALAAPVVDGELSDRHNVKCIVTTEGFIQIMSAFDGNLGSMFEKDVLDVWRGDFVQKMLHHGFLPEKCRGCRHVDACRGGSRMDANIYNGSYGADDPLADYANKPSA